MSDYTQINDYSAKDALSTGNPLKIIKGSDIDAELAAISAAIATKFDTTSIADASEAQAGSSNTVVMTPGRVTTWAANAAGIVEDLQALAAPGADRILFWDHSALATAFLEVGTGLEIDGTTLNSSGDLTAITLTAGAGLSYSVGGTDLSADATIDLDVNELTAAAIAAGDFLAFADVDDSNAPKKITFANLEAAIDPGNLGGGTSAVLETRTLTAGAGLSGGGDLSADRTFDVDITNETELAVVPADDDELLISDTDDSNTVKKISVANAIGNQLGEGRLSAASAQALSSATETDVTFGTTDYDNFQRGTWSSTTYTAGSDGAKLLVSATVTADTLGSGEELRVKIYEGSSSVVNHNISNQADSNSKDWSVTVTAVVSLSAGQVMKVTAETSQAETLGSGDRTVLSIVELG